MDTLFLSKREAGFKPALRPGLANAPPAPSRLGPGIEAVATHKVFGGRLGSGMNMQFFEDVLNVNADGPDAGPQMRGNFFVGEAFGKELKNFPFARGKSRVRQSWRGAGSKGFNDAPGDLAGHGRAVFDHFPDRAHMF